MTLPSVKKPNLGLFLILAAGIVSLVAYPDIVTATVFITVTAGYSILVRFLYGQTPD